MYNSIIQISIMYCHQFHSTIQIHSFDIVWLFLFRNSCHLTLLLTLGHLGKWAWSE
uniref:Uncharacterized protein n=1 Tax=Anguilla anguilla TaxID=7936 RepID=A0A0E9XI22_ANGAN